MARRLPRLALIFTAAALVAPAAANASSGLHLNSGAASEPTAKEALKLAREVAGGDGVKTGRELSPALRTLAEKLPELHGSDRKKAEAMLARPTQGQATDSDVKAYTSPEAAPYCGAHFCVHYVTAATDANRPPMTDSNANGVPDYVESTLREFENVYNVENNQMGWQAPKSDNGLGGTPQTDVYLADVGPEGLYGYAAADPNQTGKQWYAYLVMDNDYSEPTFTQRYGANFLEPLQVTAAHEYNHVLQYGYDGLQDSWMFEATATWMEDKVYDAIDDYKGYLSEWAKRSQQPLTQFNAPETGDSNAKVYGDAVFNRWIDEHLGQDTIRRAWEVSLETKDFAPGAYQKALAERGTSFFDVFSQFAADTAEWRAANSPFEEGNTFDDVARALSGDSLAPQSATGLKDDFASGGLDHTAYVLVNVDPKGQDKLTVGATLPRGVAGAIALVGRTGTDTTGTAVTRVTKLPKGGAGKVTLEGATGFSRVTAVIVNSDIGRTVNSNTDADGYNRNTRDWNWSGDDARITLAVNDFTRPTVRKAAPKQNAKRVGRSSKIKLTFSERIAGADRSTVKLVGPGNKSVSASVVPSGRTLKITPARKLAAGRRYTVKLAATVTDAGGNALPTSRRSFRFTTGR